MDMAVDEASRNQRILAVVFDLCAGRQLRENAVSWTKMSDQAVRHRHDGVGLVHHRVLKPALEGVTRVGQHRAANNRWLLSHLGSSPAVLLDCRKLATAVAFVR